MRPEDVRNACDSEMNGIGSNISSWTRMDARMLPRKWYLIAGPRILGQAGSGCAMTGLAGLDWAWLGLVGPSWA